MQSTHDEGKADYANKQVGMKLEAYMQLQDESGVVDYKLAIIVFRTGGQLDGHFFVAAPTPAAAWVVFNEAKVLQPMSLSALRTHFGKAVHGLMYIRMTAPAEDDWALLNPNPFLDTNAARYNFSPPIPHSLSPFLPLSMGINADLVGQIASVAAESKQEM